MPIFFETAAAFRDWLSEHAGSQTELVVGFRKLGSGLPSMSWPESVDEALCVGWIDGVRKRIDEVSYQIRFTPRKAGSIWSAINIDKVRKLESEGRMRPAGLRAFALRTESKSRTYAYEQTATAELAAAELALLRQNEAAWLHFEAQAPSYRKRILWWIVSAKQAATRAARLNKLIEASSAGQRL